MTEVIKYRVEGTNGTYDYIKLLLNDHDKQWAQEFDINNAEKFINSCSPSLEGRWAVYLDGNPAKRQPEIDINYTKDVLFLNIGFKDNTWNAYFRINTDEEYLWDSQTCIGPVWDYMIKRLHQHG